MLDWTYTWTPGLMPFVGRVVVDRVALLEPPTLAIVYFRHTEPHPLLLLSKDVTVDMLPGIGEMAANAVEAWERGDVELFDVAVEGEDEVWAQITIVGHVCSDPTCSQSKSH